MDFGLIFRTVRHLKTTQLVYQVLNRVHKSRYRQYSAPKHEALKLYTPPIPRYNSLEGDVFTFLNLGHKFTDWNYTEQGTLWTYNLNYFDFINQKDIAKEDCCYWIDKFIADCQNITWGLDPYPSALRGINWIKFFCRCPKAATSEREDSLYSQYKLLEKKLEYHVLGNHLLEDAFSLFIGSLNFEDKALYANASKLLIEQLGEQILMDGAHYEQSPMYHCILLDRLLDCINFGKSSLCEKSDNNLVQNQSSIRELENCLAADVLTLSDYAQRRLGHVESVVWSDKSIPLLNDSSNGIAPTAEQIFDYAKRLGLEWKAIPMKECGYRKMSNARIEAIVDVGNITATNQPGHSHADTFNYELRVDGKPFVVDTGVSTYNKNERRQYERSSAAHNCVSALLNGKMQDSSEVWDGFRIGRRARLNILRESHESIKATHDGYKNLCSRLFTMTENAIIIEDEYNGEAISLIHLAPEVEVEFQENRTKILESKNDEQGAKDVLIKSNLGFIKIEGAHKVEIVDDAVSLEYNKLLPIKLIKIFFFGKLRYSLTLL